VTLNKPTSFTAGKATAARAPVARAVSCYAEQKEGSKQVATGVAAAAMALTFGFGAVDAAYADVAGLTPCSESKAFAKLKKKEVRWCRGGRGGLKGAGFGFAAGWTRGSLCRRQR
jgi:photosystem I subunit 3